MSKYGKLLPIKFKYKSRSILETDCWGLCLLAAKINNQILPDVNCKAYHFRDTHKLIKEHMNKSKVWERTTPKEESIVVFSINGMTHHVGYMINETEFIHIRKDQGVSIDNIENPMFKILIAGFYRYIGE